jgi:hypothetical protein
MNPIVASRLAETMRPWWQLTRVVIIVLSLSASTATFACSSSDGGDSPCKKICDCVANAVGEQSRSQCNSQCADVQKSSNPVQGCLDGLNANGASSCSSNCGALGGGGGQAGATATLSDFCNKCADCVGSSGFQEGFCTPWASGSSFDVSGCSSGGHPEDLADKSVSRSTLSSWSCTEFDDHE